MIFRKLNQSAIGGVIGFALTVGLGALLDFTPLGKGLIRMSYDLLFKPRPLIPIDEAVVVYIDDESHAELNQSYIEPWDRALHAKLINRMKEYGAKAVVFDVVFSDPLLSRPEVDQQMAKAISENGTVVLGADYVPTARGQTAARQVNPPLDLFMDGAANIGNVELFTDDDFIVRGLFTGERDDFVSSLCWATAELVGAKSTQIEKEEEKFQERWINYYGPPRYLPEVSYHRVVSDKTDPVARADPSIFKDKIVFVGAHIITYLQGQRKDEYRSPLSYWVSDRGTKDKFMPGVEIQATTFLNLFRGDWLSRLPRKQETVILVVFGLVFGFGITQFRPFYATLVSLITVLAIAAVAYWAFESKLVWFPWAIPVMAQVPVALGWSVLFNSINLYVSKRLMEQSLSMYVSPSRVKQIAKNPKILRPGAEKQEVSILFSDIANFTNMSEGMDSDRLASLMNNYFETTVGQCIHPTHGTVVKFIGDAIFAIWNAPEPQADHRELACRGGLLLRDSASKFDLDDSNLVIRTRIGLHCGVANVGNFGSSTRVDYTALGENINLAARMESLNKHVGTDLLITGDIYSTVRDKFVTRLCGNLQLKGFEKAVEVHELLGTIDQADQFKAWRETYAAALQHFESAEFKAAEEGFRATIDMRGEDGPSKFMLKQIEEFRIHPPAKDWKGVVELKEK